MSHKDRVLVLAQVVEDFGLVRFLPLAIEDRDSVARVLADVDRANGCAFSGLAAAAAPLPPELTYGAGLRSAPLRINSRGCHEILLLGICFENGKQLENFTVFRHRTIAYTELLMSAL